MADDIDVVDRSEQNESVNPPDIMDLRDEKFKQVESNF